MGSQRILITGSKGFIGKHLVSYLAERGHTVVSYEGDITKPFAVSEPIDAVVHLAAKTHIPWCATHPAETINVNVDGTLNALECARVKKARFIFASAAAVYGVSNDGIREDVVPKPANMYGVSKYLAEQLSAFYAATHKVPCIALRLFNVYGPGQKSEFLIPSLLASIKSGAPIELKSPKSVRDYVYIDDVAGAFERAASGELPDAFSVCNIASGVGHSVGEVVDALAGAARTIITVHANENAPGDIFTADIRRAKALLGWEPAVSFGDGLKKIVAAA